MKADLKWEWVKLRNLELNDLNFLTNIVGVIKSREMSWAVHVVSMGEEKCLQGFGG